MRLRNRRISAKTEVLLREIFVRDEDERLGGTDIGEIMEHPWFDNLDWDAVVNGTLRPLQMFPEGYLNSNNVFSQNDGEKGRNFGSCKTTTVKTIANRMEVLAALSAGLRTFN